MPTIRQATPDDGPALVRLRSAFSRELRGELFAAGSDEAWQSILEEVAARETQSGRMRILVVDGERGLAACAVGVIDQWLPAPHLTDGRIGHILSVYTDHAYRRRGYSRAIVEELLAWFTEHAVLRVDLHASPAAEALYWSLGFDDHPDPSLSWRPPTTRD
jgi:GNAT superfamily N-acetyltransferase